MKSTRSLPFALLACGLLGLLTTSAIQAQLLYDPFDYAVGNTLGSNGWTLLASSGGVATNVVAQNLSQPGLAPSSGNALQLRPNGQDWYDTYTSQNHTTSDNTVLYFSMLIRVDDLGLLNATGGYFGGLSFDGISLTAPIGLRTSGAGFQIGIAKRDSTTVDYAATVHSVGSTILVVGAYNWVSGSIQNDFASLWVDPSSLGAGSAPTETLTASTTGVNNDILSLNSFTWKPQGNATSTQIPASLIVDELRVGTTWASVTPVPEPTAAVLLGLGSVVGLGLARRKRDRIC